MITIRNLSKRYDGHDALRGVDLDVPDGSVTAIIGPSGSGKTTLLRLLDLLEQPDAGSITWDGEESPASEDARLAMRRRIGMVFQKPVAFSGSVFDNVSYGLRVRGHDRRAMRERVRRALETVDLAGYESRSALTLSGGEIQRVALARTMVTEPQLLLLDEPTANLDPVSTARVEELIGRVIAELRTTVVMATHDMAQGQRLADRIGVLIGGAMLQVGNPSEVFNLPSSVHVARFVGVENLLEGVIESGEAGMVNARVGDRLVEGVSELAPGVPVFACVRPEEVVLARTQAPTSARNAFPGVITATASMGPLARVVVDCGFPLVALVTARSALELGLTVGAEVSASFKATGVHIVPR